MTQIAKKLTNPKSAIPVKVRFLLNFKARGRMTKFEGWLPFRAPKTFRPFRNHPQKAFFAKKSRGPARGEHKRTFYLIGSRCLCQAAGSTLCGGRLCTGCLFGMLARDPRANQGSRHGPFHQNHLPQANDPALFMKIVIELYQAIGCNEGKAKHNGYKLD